MGMVDKNLCNSCTNIGCEFQSGIVRTECAFYMPPHIEPDNCGNYVVQDSTTKNDLGVDCISRAYLYNRIKGIDHDEDYECDEFGGSKITYHTCDWDEVLREIEDAPSVTPQEPKIGHWRPIYQGDEIIDYRCSKCEFGNTFGKSTHGMNYCPHCGAKMVGLSHRKVRRGMRKDEFPLIDAYADSKVNEVLGKIRAEIIELRIRQNVGVLECLEIIDKYKAESEGEE